MITITLAPWEEVILARAKAANAAKGKIDDEGRPAPFVRITRQQWSAMGGYVNNSLRRTHKGNRRFAYFVRSASHGEARYFTQGGV